MGVIFLQFTLMPWIMICDPKEDTLSISFLSLFGVCWHQDFKYGCRGDHVMERGASNGERELIQARRMRALEDQPCAVY